MAQKNESSACTHDESGMYACSIDATDTNTSGVLTVTVAEAGTLVWSRDYDVIAAAYYDLTDGTTTLMDSKDAGQVLEDTINVVTSQTVMSVNNGAPGVDAYNTMVAWIEDVSNSNTPCQVDILDYSLTTETLTLRGQHNSGADACPFTIVSGDEIRIRTGTSGGVAKLLKDDMDDIAAADGTGVNISDADLDVIWDKLCSEHVTTDTVGDQVCAVLDSILAASPTAAAIVNEWESQSQADPTGFHVNAMEVNGTAQTAGDLSALITGLNDPTAAAIAAAVMAETCEDQGGGYTVQECLSILLAEAAGTAVYTTGTRTWVLSDPSGAETRLTIVYGSDLDGDRTTSTPAPVTP